MSLLDYPHPSQSAQLLGDCPLALSRPLRQEKPRPRPLPHRNRGQLAPTAYEAALEGLDTAATKQRAQARLSSIAFQGGLP